MKEQEFITISCNGAKPASGELPQCYSTMEFVEYHFRKVCWLIVDAYGNYKHEAYYTKGKYYDSQDRILSKTVIEAILNSKVKFKNVGSNNAFIFSIIKDDVAISIEVTSSNMREMNINIESNITKFSKINREACYMFVKHALETIFSYNTFNSKEDLDYVEEVEIKTYIDELEDNREASSKGHHYNEDVFKRMVEENMRESRRNDNILRFNKYGARRIYQDEVDKVSDIPRCFIEDVVADGNDE